MIVREIDRVNRQGQDIASLDARVMKLRGLAAPFLREMKNDGGDREQRAEAWLGAWDHVTETPWYLYTKGPRWVRWKQFELLVALFHEVGVFLEDAIPWEKLTMFGVEGQSDSLAK